MIRCGKVFYGANPLEYGYRWYRDMTWAQCAMLRPRIFFTRILRVSRGGKLTTGLMDLIVLSDWLFVGWGNPWDARKENHRSEISDPFCRNLACFTLADIYKHCLVQAVCSRKTWTVAIFSQLSLSEIRLWKLAQARCYQPVSPCKDFHHQDFSMIAVDTQEWNWGSWGCGRGRMHCKVWHCAARPAWDGKHALRSFRPQICCVLNSSSNRMGCIQFNCHLPSRVDVHEWWNFMKLNIHEDGFLWTPTNWTGEPHPLLTKMHGPGKLDTD